MSLIFGWEDGARLLTAAQASVPFLCSPGKKAGFRALESGCKAHPQQFAGGTESESYPRRAEGLGTEDEIYRVFPTAPLAHNTEKNACVPVASSSCFFLPKRCMRWRADTGHSARIGKDE